MEEAVYKRRVRLGARGAQGAYDRNEVPVMLRISVARRGAHSGVERRAAKGITRARVGATRQQALHGVEVIRAGGEPQWRAPEGVARIGRGTILKQLKNGLCVAVETGQPQGLIALGGLRAGAGTQQGRDDARAGHARAARCD